MAEKLIYPLDEATEMLGGISRAQVYRLIEAGDLERVNIGRRAFITRESLHELAASGAKASA